MFPPRRRVLRAHSVYGPACLWASPPPPRSFFAAAAAVVACEDAIKTMSNIITGQWRRRTEEREKEGKYKYLFCGDGGGLAAGRERAGSGITSICS